MGFQASNCDFDSGACLERECDDNADCSGGFECESFKCVPIDDIVCEPSSITCAAGGHGLRQCSAESPDFWNNLWPRAQELDLARPLYYGLRYVAAFMGTPIPQTLIDRVATAGPTGIFRTLMDALFLRALRPAHATCSDRLTPIARWLLYVRAHWLRMPMHLLVWHLGHKALRRQPEQPEPVADPPA